MNSRDSPNFPAVTTNYSPNMGKLFLQKIPPKLTIEPGRD